MVPGKKQPTAVGYARVSTESQVDGESLNTQRRQIEEYASFKKWNLIRIYDDPGVSGGKAANRPGLNKLMEDSRTNGAFDYVVFTKFSRFARNTRDFLEYRDELKMRGVDLASTHENIDTSTHTGELMLTLLVAVAQWEKDVIREQTSENKMAKWADHRCFIGKPPFGYFWNKKTNKLEVNDKEKEIYDRIVIMYVKQGLSYRDIQIQLTKEGIRCKRAWFSNTTISYILKNPCYYGHYLVNTRVYEHEKDENGKTISAKAKRTKQMKPAEEHIEFPIPYIIMKPDWDDIQKHTEFNKIKSKRTTWSKDYWLRDVVYCGRCAGKMHPHMGRTRKDGTFPRYYCCYWASTSAKSLVAAQRERCSLPYIPADILEKEVWDQLLDLLRYPFQRRRHIDPLLDSYKQYEDQIQKLEAEIGELNRQHKKVQKSREKIFELYEGDDGEEHFSEEKRIDKNELAERLFANRKRSVEIEGRLGEAIKKLNDLQIAQQNDKAAAEFIHNRRGAIKRMLDDMGRLSPADKKRVIESVLEDCMMDVFDVPEKDFVPDEDRTHMPPFFNVRFRFNQEIFQWLLDEGKISPIDPDEPDDDPPKGQGNQGDTERRLDQNGIRNTSAVELR